MSHTFLIASKQTVVTIKLIYLPGMVSTLQDYCPPFKSTYQVLILLNVLISFPKILLKALLEYTLLNSYFGSLSVFSVGVRV